MKFINIFSQIFQKNLSLYSEGIFENKALKRELYEQLKHEKHKRKEKL